MPDDTPTPVESQVRRPLWKTAAGIGVTALLLTMLMYWLIYAYYPRQIGPQQPIAFSHRFHVTDKRISCMMCHTGTADSSRAGIPPLETCMLCHSRIIVAHPQIRILRKHYDSGQPVPWVSVSRLPNHVYFSHERHVRAGFDCGQCHGNVAQMDRVAQVQVLNMGFCVQCHKDNQYSHDCYICHR